MAGVEILSSETIYNTVLPEYWIGIGLGCALVFIITMAFCFAYEHTNLGLICAACAMLSVILSIISSLGCTYSKTDINHIKYKITVDDSVSLNEFLDKYEILDKEGKIYTVKEKE